MTILNMPSSPGFTDSRFGLRSNTQTDLTSPLSQTSQFLELPGARWYANYTLPSMSRDQAAAWQAFLVTLRGRAGRFYGFDPDARTPRGSAKAKAFGTLKIVAGSPEPSGNTLVVDGAGASEQGVFRAGDYLAYDVATGRQLHMVTADVDADASGVMSLTIEPPIRTSPADNSNVIVATATCIMRLVNDDPGWDANRISRYGISFEAIEVFA